jgi:hypothetical protein
MLEFHYENSWNFIGEIGLWQLTRRGFHFDGLQVYIKINIWYINIIMVKKYGNST